MDRERTVIQAVWHKYPGLSVRMNGKRVSPAKGRISCRARLWTIIRAFFPVELRNIKTFPDLFNPVPPDQLLFFGPGAPFRICRATIVQDAAIHRPCIAVARVKGVFDNAALQVFHPVFAIIGNKAGKQTAAASRGAVIGKICAARTGLACRDVKAIHFQGHLVHIHITGYRRQSCLIL